MLYVTIPDHVWALQTGKVRWRFAWEGSASTRSGLLSTDAFTSRGQ